MNALDETNEKLTSARNVLADRLICHHMLEKVT